MGLADMYQEYKRRDVVVFSLQVRTKSCIESSSVILWCSFKQNKYVYYIGSVRPKQLVLLLKSIDGFEKLLLL